MIDNTIAMVEIPKPHCQPTLSSIHNTNVQLKDEMKLKPIQRVGIAQESTRVHCGLFSLSEQAQGAKGTLISVLI